MSWRRAHNLLPNKEYDLSLKIKSYVQESKSMSPEKVNEAFVTKEEKTLVGSSPIHFNNNIYNNV